MRIGILTFCNAYNLGAALQSFSLQKAVEQKGHDSELIDYRCTAIEKMHRLMPLLQRGISLKRRLYNLAYNIVFFPRRIRFNKFQKLTKRSKAYSRDTIRFTNDKYDLFISGSDQVFNLELTGNDRTFYLDFVSDGIKASYAASLGVYLDDKKEQYYTDLQSFDNLSVREKSSAKMLYDKLGISAEIVPDPVFLHSSEEWIRLLDSSENNRRKYVLVYSLIEDKQLYDIAQMVAMNKGLKTYVITKALRPLGKAEKVFRNTGPRQFIDLIAGAEYVVTNSFHGTAFSLIFKKQFATVLPPVASDRIRDLLESVGLYDCIIESSSKVNMNTIDYSEVEDRITAMKNKGEKYLEEILS